MFLSFVDFSLDKKGKLYLDLKDIKTGDEYCEVPESETLVYRNRYDKRCVLCQKEPKFVFFWRPTSYRNTISHSCLSQWYDNGFKGIDGILYKSAEQYMMAQKAKFFDDEETLEKIMSAETSAEFKSLGKKVRNFDEEKWSLVKGAIIFAGNVAKFSGNKPLKKYILSTKNAILVEASPFDRVYGIGMLGGKDAEDPNNWKGTNLLGFVLMEVRDYLKK